MNKNLVRFVTLLSGVAGMIVPNVVGSLPTGVQGVATAAGGLILAVLAYLEHPTAVAKATKTPVTLVASSTTTPVAK